MRLVLAAVSLASLWVGVGAEAATLTVTADKQAYQVGETITLSIVGDSEGATAWPDLVYGIIEFDGSLVSWQSTNQTLLTSFDGAVTWVGAGHVAVCGTASRDGDACAAFDQIGGLLQPMQVDDLLYSTMTFVATASGVATFDWLQLASGEQFPKFFDLDYVPAGVSVMITTPEPTAGSLLALGLLGLGMRARRNRPAA